MREQPRVLIVDCGTAGALAADALRARGFTVGTAGSFHQAWEVVLSEPLDALVTELRLGAFNGLHLILRLRNHSPDAAAIVYTAFPDPVLEKLAYQIGADYLVRDEDAVSLVTLFEQRLGHREERRRSARKHLAVPIVAHVASMRALLVDISHDGFCVEAPNAIIESPVEIRLPLNGVLVTARIVWSRQRRDGNEELQFGASLSDLAPEARYRWRTIVDSA